MGLRERLEKPASGSSISTIENLRFERFGIIDNPFPSASQTQGHPRMETDADDTIANFVVQYNQNRSSQVLVIEGDQGTGKTNLLNYYENQFKDIYPEGEGYYIIRYYADPEPGFDKLLGRIFLQEFGSEFFLKIGKNLSTLDKSDLSEKMKIVRSSDLRIILYSLKEAASKSQSIFNDTAVAALEWVIGSRLYKRHREVLGQIQFRLDTVESKTQVFRDLIYFCAELGIFNGLILLLDELEKMDDTTSKTTVLRFLSAIRAMIDALPKYLFLMAAMTPTARERYFVMLPAFAGRLQNRIKLNYLSDIDSATKLHNFYIDDAKGKATLSLKRLAPKSINVLFSDSEFNDLFVRLLKSAKERGDAGIRHRDFLNELHLLVENKISNL